MDRFAIVAGHYIYYTLNHGGQGSYEYKRLSKMSGYFKPSPFLSLENLEDDAREVYDQLCKRNNQ